MRVVSSAKRGGGVDCLYPDRDPRKAPWHLAAAVSHSLAVLGWMELSEDMQPPESIWLNPELLNDHFERVLSKDGMERVEQVPMMENEATKGLRRR
jgi:hypothetical protein